MRLARTGFCASACGAPLTVVAPIAVLAVVVILVVWFVLLVVVATSIAAATPMLLEGLANGLTLFVAQVPVAILIEPLHEFGSRGLAIARRSTKTLRRPASMRPSWRPTGTCAVVAASRSTRTAATRVFATSIAVFGIAVFIAIVRPTAKVRVKCLACRFAFLVADLAVAVLVDPLQHCLAEGFAMRTMSRTRMWWSLRARTAPAMRTARSVVAAIGKHMVRRWTMMAWTGMARTAAPVVAMCELATTNVTVASAMWRGVSVPAMPVAVATVRMLALATFAATIAAGLSVGRLFKLLPHGGPLLVAQLAVAIGIETSQHDVAERIAAAVVSARPRRAARAMRSLSTLLRFLALFVPLLRGRLVLILRLVAVIGTDGQGDQGHEPQRHREQYTTRTHDLLLLSYDERRAAVRLRLDTSPTE